MVAKGLRVKTGWVCNQSVTGLAKTNWLSLCHCEVGVVIAVWVWSLQNQFIPGEEYLLLLRRVVKHVHYFTNGCSYSPAMSVFSLLISVTDTLRRLAPTAVSLAPFGSGSLHLQYMQALFTVGLGSSGSESLHVPLALAVILVHTCFLLL